MPFHIILDIFFKIRLIALLVNSKLFLEDIKKAIEVKGKVKHFTSIVFCYRYQVVYQIRLALKNTAAIFEGFYVTAAKYHIIFQSKNKIRPRLHLNFF